jgi:hypothetical protein
LLSVAFFILMFGAFVIFLHIISVTREHPRSIATPRGHLGHPMATHDPRRPPTASEAICKSTRQSVTPKATPEANYDPLRPNTIPEATPTSLRKIYGRRQGLVFFHKQFLCDQQFLCNHVSRNHFSRPSALTWRFADGFIMFHTPLNLPQKEIRDELSTKLSEMALITYLTSKNS